MLMRNSLVLMILTVGVVPAGLSQHVGGRTDTSGRPPVRRWPPTDTIMKTLGFNGRHDGMRDELRLVVRDSVTWQAVWPRLIGKPQHPPPVDFRREMLVIAAMGQRSTGGYSIAITINSDSSGPIIATVWETLPGPTCGVSTRVTSPIDVRRIPKSDPPVLFVERTEIATCRD